MLHHPGQPWKQPIRCWGSLKKEINQRYRLGINTTDSEWSICDLQVVKVYKKTGGWTGGTEPSTVVSNGREQSTVQSMTLRHMETHGDKWRPGDTWRHRDQIPSQRSRGSTQGLLKEHVNSPCSCSGLLWLSPGYYVHPPLPPVLPWCPLHHPHTAHICGALDTGLFLNQAVWENDHLHQLCQRHLFLLRLQTLARIWDFAANAWRCRLDLHRCKQHQDREEFKPRHRPRGETWAETRTAAGRGDDSTSDQMQNPIDYWHRYVLINLPVKKKELNQEMIRTTAALRPELLMFHSWLLLFNEPLHKL